MAIAVSIFGLAFAAFCVWLTVRIVNRRERWAKRLAVGLMAVLVVYPLSYGPLPILLSRLEWYSAFDLAVACYRPLEWVTQQTEFTADAQHWWYMLWVDILVPD